MSYNPQNPNGQTTSANSAPVVLASDQSALTTKIQDGSGNGLSSLSDGNGGKALEVALAATGFQYASGNSTTTQLTAGASFTGTIDSVINQQAYSILIVSDQNGTLNIKQYIDAGGTQLAQTLGPYSITGGQGFAKSGVMNGNYSQVVFTNNGSLLTTTLAINTYYGTIPSANQLGNLPVSIGDINGQTLTSGSLPVVGSTTAGSGASSGLITVQGNASGTPVPVSGSVTVFQSTAASLNATVTGTVNVQQVTAGSLNANVSQSVASNLNATVAQPTAANLNATVVQPTASNLNATVAQPTAANLNATVVGTVTATQATGTNLHTVVDSGSVTATQATASALNATVVGAGTAGTPSGGVVSVQGVSSGTALPVSAAALPLPSGAATSANQTSVIGALTAGTSATNSELVGGVYTSSIQNSPTAVLTTGQQIAEQLDQFANQMVVLPDLLFTGQSAQTALVNNIIPATAGSTATTALNYRSATIQINSTGTAGGYIFEGSNDNVNFFTLTAYNITTITGTPITAAVVPSAANIIYALPVQTAYIRVRISTAVTGGSIQAFTRLSQAPFSPPVFQVAQATGANLNTAVSSLPTLAAVTTVSTVTKGQGAAPATVTDVASAAITVTTTSAGITPTFGSSYIVSLDTTAAAGTGSFVVQIQESIDNTNWYTVYTFPSVTVASGVVTANGVLVSPTINMTGYELRYVQTLTGITSVTRQIIRSQASTSAFQQPVSGILTDGSTTTSATPSTATTALAIATAGRKYLFLQNTSSSATIYFNFTTTAVVGQPSIQLLPGASFVQESGFVSTELISIISSVASVPYVLKWA